jgi:hypothetical protein
MILIYSPRKTLLAEECRSCAILAPLCRSTGRNIDARKNIGCGASADKHEREGADELSNALSVAHR